MQFCLQIPYCLTQKKCSGRRQKVNEMSHYISVKQKLILKDVIHGTPFFNNVPLLPKQSVQVLKDSNVN